MFNDFVLHLQMSATTMVMLVAVVSMHKLIFEYAKCKRVASSLYYLYFWRNWLVFLVAGACEYEKDESDNT